MAKKQNIVLQLPYYFSYSTFFAKPFLGKPESVLFYNRHCCWRLCGGKWLRSRDPQSRPATSALSNRK
jgi:hypothetical protein